MPLEQIGIYRRISRESIIRILIILLVGLVLSLIFPIMHFYTWQDGTSLDDLTTYSQVLSEILPEKVQKKATKKNCRGLLEPVTIKEEDSSLPHLSDDINLALTVKYEGWSLKADSSTEARIIRQNQEVWKKWGKEIPGDVIRRIISGQVDAAFPDYRASAEWYRIANPDPDDIQLNISILDGSPGNNIFSVTVIFTHPKRERKLRVLEALAKIGWYGSILFSVMLTLFGIFVMSLFLYGRSQDKKYLASVYQDTYRLVKDMFDLRSYVTGMELIERHLKFFPEDFKILALKERLKILTKNDPEKAEAAYVITEKLKTRLKAAETIPSRAVLAEDEKYEAKVLAPFNPELGDILVQLSSIAEDCEANKMLAAQTQDIVRLLDIGKIGQAKKETANLLTKHPDNPEVVEVRTKTDARHSEAKNQFEEVKLHLSNGDVALAREDLEAFIRSYQDYEPAIRLRAELDQATGAKHFRLQRKGGSRDLIIRCQHQVVLGRPDVGVSFDIEMNDRRISRPHARITLRLKNVIVEDLESSNGTYINGEHVTSNELRTGDLLTLGKVLDFSATIIAEEDHIGGLFLSSEASDYLIIASKVSFGIKEDQVRIPGDYTIHHNEDIAILKGPTGTILLRHGVQIRLGDKIYNVEVLK